MHSNVVGLLKLANFLQQLITYVSDNCHLNQQNTFLFCLTVNLGNGYCKLPIANNKLLQLAL